LCGKNKNVPFPHETGSLVEETGYLLHHRQIEDALCEDLKAMSRRFFSLITVEDCGKSLRSKRRRITK
jgi:hypothetical protein